MERVRRDSAAELAASNERQRELLDTLEQLQRSTQSETETVTSLSSEVAQLLDKVGSGAGLAAGWQLMLPSHLSSSSSFPRCAAPISKLLQLLGTRLPDLPPYFRTAPHSLPSPSLSLQVAEAGRALSAEREAAHVARNEADALRWELTAVQQELDRERSFAETVKREAELEMTASAQRQV